VSSSHAPDKLYLLALGALITVGVVMMYSAVAFHGDPYDLYKLLGGLLLGGILMWVSSKVPLPWLRTITPFLLFACFLLLVSLKVGGAGWAVTTNGATRWIRLPAGLTFQPSEFTKVGFVLFAAHFLDRRGQKLTLMGGKYWAVFLGVLGILAGLIYKEPDLGTALVLSGTAFLMLIAVGVDWRLLSAGAIVGGVLVLALAWYTPHQQARLVSWWNPWAAEHRQDGGYQVIRSWMAIARGGLFGVGLGQSTQKLENRLPESETDFIFAIVAEELGLFRALGVIALFGVLIWRGFSIAARAPDRYAGLLVTGFTSWVAVQSCLNLAVVTGTVPNTGVPLPYLSSGLSSLMALMIGAGIVIGISTRTRVSKQVAKSAPVR